MRKKALPLRCLCFGILLTATVCRLLSEGSFLPASAQTAVYEEQKEEYPALSYALPEVVKLNFAPEDAALVEVEDRSGLTWDQQSLLTRTLDFPLGQEPAVLIIHTHTTEAYSPAPSYRSKDPQENVARVGQAVAEILRENGIPTLHDTTLHDGSAYEDAYEKAAQTVETYLQQYPGIQMVIDIHRDAVAGSDGAQLAFCSQVEGRQGAQLLFVMGTNAAGQYHPNWQGNLSLALKLQTLCEKEAPGLFRDLSLRSQRYNQHLTPYSLLLEVGTAGNTLEEAILSAEFFAQQLSRLLLQGTRTSDRSFYE